MQRLILLLISLYVLISCDDGDIIVTSFDFEDQDIDLCTNVDDADEDDVNYVFYKINNDTQEALAFQITTSDSILSQLTTTGNSYEYTFGTSNNQVTYRRFDATVDSDYFCNNLPPGSPRVIDEYSSVEGTVTINTAGDQLDEDGIAAEFEETLLGETDYDGDGIPNVYDFDDDGDNVPTSNEGVVLNEDGSIDMEESLDTDADGIPDFLDNDDDGDGVLTIDEDANGDLNPSNDSADGITDDYKNPDVSVDYMTTAYRANSFILTNIQLTIVLEGLVFENQNGDDVIRQQRLEFGIYEPSSQDKVITPEFVE